MQRIGSTDLHPEPHRPHGSKWTDKPDEIKRAVINNRQRMSRDKGREYQRRRSERVERSFAHVCDTGGTRRTWLRGIASVSKRYLMAAAAHNLGLVMRKLFGIGKPRGLRAGVGLADLLWLAIRWLRRPQEPIRHTKSSTNAMSLGPIPYALVG